MARPMMATAGQNRPQDGGRGRSRGRDRRDTGSRGGRGRGSNPAHAAHKPAAALPTTPRTEVEVIDLVDKDETVETVNLLDDDEPDSKRSKTTPEDVSHVYDDGESRNWVVMAMVTEDDAARETYGRCRGAVRREVHDHCFVRDGARHFTLFKLNGLTRAEANRVGLAHAPTALPLDGLELTKFLRLETPRDQVCSQRSGEISARGRERVFVERSRSHIQGLVYDANAIPPRSHPLSLSLSLVVVHGVLVVGPVGVVRVMRVISGVVPGSGCHRTAHGGERLTEFLSQAHLIDAAVRGGVEVDRRELRAADVVAALLSLVGYAIVVMTMVTRAPVLVLLLDSLRDPLRGCPHRRVLTLQHHQLRLQRRRQVRRRQRTLPVGERPS